MQNLWDQERKKIFRELYRQYLDEGYNHKEAKRLAAEEAEDLASTEIDFIKGIITAEYGEDSN